MRSGSCVTVYTYKPLKEDKRRGRLVEVKERLRTHVYTRNASVCTRRRSQLEKRIMPAKQCNVAYLFKSS